MGQISFLVLGNTAEAHTIALASFLGVISPLLFSSLSNVYAALARVGLGTPVLSLALRLTLSLGVLLPTTILMGGTLPPLSRLATPTLGLANRSYPNELSPQKGLAYLHRLLESGGESQAQVYRKIAHIYAAARDYQTALSYLEQAAKRATQEGKDAFPVEHL